jgi:hypothetical protein
MWSHVDGWQFAGINILTKDDVITIGRVEIDEEYSGTKLHNSLEGLIP